MQPSRSKSARFGSLAALLAALTLGAPAFAQQQTETPKTFGRWSVLLSPDIKAGAAWAHATGTVRVPDYCDAVLRDTEFGHFRKPEFQERVRRSRLACVIVVCRGAEQMASPVFDLSFVFFGTAVPRSVPEAREPGKVRLAGC